jgi:hypothetical protein
METLNNRVSTVIELWKPINARTPEDGGSTFSETLDRSSITRYKVPENVYKTKLSCF